MTTEAEFKTELMLLGFKPSLDKFHPLDQPYEWKLSNETMWVGRLTWRVITEYRVGEDYLDTISFSSFENTIKHVRNRLYDNQIKSNQQWPNAKDRHAGNGEACPEPGDTGA